MESIAVLLADSQFQSIRDLVSHFQTLYPSDWVYKPIGIEIELTNKCNLKCAGCGQRDESERPADLLSTSDYSNFLATLKESPIMACSLTGGETLLFLERVETIIQNIAGHIDFFKLNSNSYRFINTNQTRAILERLKSAGYGVSNRYIKAVFVTSIGQQNQAGMQLENSVNLVSQFYDIFDFSQAICSVNATDKNIQIARSWNDRFRAMYSKMTAQELDEKKVFVREFMLNSIPTLNRLGLTIKHTASIPALIENFKHQFSSWQCLNQLPSDDQEPTTLMPKCVLRPNGDLYACPGYNYVHNLGNIRDNSFMELVARANNDPVLRTMYFEGLTGLWKLAVKRNPALKKQQLSLSYGPCDICQHLSQYVRAAS